MSRYKLKAALTAAILAPVAVMAAEPGTAAAAQETASFNPVLLALVTMAVVLVFANGLLGIVLKQLAQACLDKSKKEKANAGVVKTMLLLAAFSLPALGAFAQDAAAVAEVAESPFIEGIARDDFYFLIGINAFLLFVMFVLVMQIRMLIRVLRAVPQTAHIPRVVLKRNFLDIFNKSVAVDKEADIMLDHDYDGIRELDNDLPPWWKWGFVLTVIASFIYVGYYHFGSGPLQVEEFNIAMAKAEEEKAAYLAKSANNVDENTVKLISDAGELSAAGTIFQTTCAACHAKDGGGGVGPNLTDNFWMHGGSLSDVFKSIKYGWPDKGMKSWKDDYSPKQIAALTSYIKTLQGSKPAAPKEAQGEPFQDGAVKDSAGAKTAMLMQ